MHSDTYTDENDFDTVQARLSHHHRQRATAYSIATVRDATGLRTPTLRAELLRLDHHTRPRAE